LTDTRFGGGSENVTDSSSKSIITIDHSKNSTNDDDTQLGDGSKMIGSDSSKSDQGKIASDESDKEEEEAVSKNSSRKKQGFHGEECDPSNMCIDDEHEFSACLRVPGNGESFVESLYLLCLKQRFFWLLVLSFVTSLLLCRCSSSLTFDSEQRQKGFDCYDNCSGFCSVRER